MAFMMPVVKNEWDIYKTNRSRRSSECSNPQACRSRKRNVILTTEFIVKRLGVLEIGGPVVVDVPRLGFSDLAGASLGAGEHAPLLAHVLASIPELPAIAQQKHRLVAAKNRQLVEPKQISQPSGGQAEALAATSRGQRLRRPAQPVVKQSGGFGPTAPLRLETVQRGKAHLGAAADHYFAGCGCWRQQPAARQQQQQQQHKQQQPSNFLVVGR
ncbi:uncharacterized protein LOC131667560 isoform X1 [Phymastichus coffea]|uniref:uncharacterized protein LOC131667560 isoform X1 n=1 Tax=Phymastichus coffea TaxID=108790 RepID=UPI00273AA14C|nr:uncharacterized protein LOC131667560 isoform X1 [Phymastichus coffea]